MYSKQNTTFYFVTTRFSNETYNENMNARAKYIKKYYPNQYDRYIDRLCIYGSPLKMTEKIPLFGKIFILEMNNSTNTIEGIGYISNSICYTKRVNIHIDRNYNRYIYKGKYWVSRKVLDIYDKDLMKTLDTLVFYGKDNMKRIQGFSLFTKKKFDTIKKELYRFVRNVFIEVFVKQCSKKIN